MILAKTGSGTSSYYLPVLPPCNASPGLDLIYMQLHVRIPQPIERLMRMPECGEHWSLVNSENERVEMPLERFQSPRQLPFSGGTLKDHAENLLRHSYFR